MPSCCFLTMDDLGTYVADDYLAAAPLLGLGWKTEFVSWRAPIQQICSCDAVIIRSTWDYHLHPQEFIESLKAIEDTGTRLENPLSLVEWNLDKSYLLHLQRLGHPIVPTRICDNIAPDEFAEWQDFFSSGELIIKPTIGATAKDTYRLSHRPPKDLVDKFSGRNFLLQPFIESILSIGEYSLFYFAGAYSHAIRKTPQPGDFRVQEDFGGHNAPYEPEDSMIEIANKILESITPTPLYARLDLVLHDNELHLMELELIEPSLYFRICEGAAERFAKCLVDHMQRPR